MKTIYSRYDKTKINDLPRVVFDGRIFVITTEGEADKAVAYLRDAEMLGIDTETRPVFQRKQRAIVSLLQLSTHDTCFLFRLNIMGVPDSVKQLLEDESIPKIGLSLHDDVHSLSQRMNFTPGAFYDLQDHFKEIGVKDLSLQKLYANVFGEKISKGQRLSNWDADVLKESQKEYAATDAWACLKLYEELKRLKETDDYKLVVVPEPDILKTDDKAKETATDNPDTYKHNDNI